MLAGTIAVLLVFISIIHLLIDVRNKIKEMRKGIYSFKIPENSTQTFFSYNIHFVGYFISNLFISYVIFVWVTTIILLPFSFEVSF